MSVRTRTCINPETNKPYATFEDIGRTVYGCKYDDFAKGQAGTAYKDALRLTADFPTYDYQCYVNPAFLESRTLST